MTDDNKQAAKPKGKKGVPLFDKETMARIIQEAMAPGANMAQIARKYRTSEYNVYRWVRLHKRRQGLSTPSDSTSNRGARVAGGQYRIQPAQRRAQGDEVERLREENRRLYELVGRLTVEKEELLKKKQ